MYHSCVHLYILKIKTQSFQIKINAVIILLGATLQIMLDIPAEISIIVSVSVTMFYTVIGGLSYVAYSDVLQLSLTFVGLVKACFLKDLN